MFVRESKYKRVKADLLIHQLELQAAKAEAARLVKKWDDLVDRINRLGGEAFLQRKLTQQFTTAELKTLIKLCHPDKHAGSAESEEITKRLLSMREET